MVDVGVQWYNDEGPFLAPPMAESKTIPMNDLDCLSFVYSLENVKLTIFSLFFNLHVDSMGYPIAFQFFTLLLRWFLLFATMNSSSVN